MSSDPRLQQAVAELARAARARLARHPLGHLVPRHDARAALELALELPLSGGEEALARAAAELDATLDRELERLLARRAVVRPGRVLCLRCRGVECEHAVPAAPGEVFTGYGPSGRPRFVDLAQWLLERGDPRVEQLYGGARRMVTVISSGRELQADLITVFRDLETGYRVLGQVAAGWLPLRPERRRPGDVARGARPIAPVSERVRLALTFQVVAAEGRGGRRRLGTNLLGVGPGGEPLGELHDRLEGVPLAAVMAWAQSVLESIERAQTRREVTPEWLSARIEGVIQSVARRLARERRAGDRRTRHADRRHRAGDRPTRQAHADLARADLGDVLVDRYRDTLIVLGERGRAHVWSPAGKLVTSIRYTPESLAKKRAGKRWHPAEPPVVADLRRKVGIATPASPDAPADPSPDPRGG